MAAMLASAGAGAGCSIFGDRPASGITNSSKRDDGIGSSLLPLVHEYRGSGRYRFATPDGDTSSDFAPALDGTAVSAYDP